MALRYEELLERARDAASLLAPAEQAHARRALAVCKALAVRPRDDTGTLLPQDDDGALRVELGRLAEVLGRRSSHAIPLASLARAALADLAGRADQAIDLLSEVDRQLSLQGL